MKSAFVTWVTLSCLVLAGALQCGWAAAPPKGRQLIGPEELSLFKLEGATECARQEIVPVKGMPFTKAIRIQTIGYPETPEDVRLVTKVPKPIDDCDRVLLTFYARGLKAVRAEAGAGLQVQIRRVKFNRALNVAHEARIGVKEKWTKINLPFYSSGNWKPETDPAVVIFHLGFPEQTIEIGGIELTDYGDKIDITTLPHPETSYVGREPNAPWRKAAAERIEKNRKGDLTIQVTDAAGKPLGGAEVSVVQKEHAFPFGIMVDALLVMEDERYCSPAPNGYDIPKQDCVKYRQVVLDLFNTTNASDYCLSWPVFEWHDNPDPNNRGRWKSELGLKTIRWLHQNGKRTMGNMLIWPQYMSKDFPKDLVGVNAEQFKAKAKKHIVDVMRAVPKNETWIVFNESAWGDGDPNSYPENLFRLVGKEFMVECFELAHRISPKAKLLLNDGRIITWGGMETGKQQAVEDQIRYLLEHKAPIDGLGFESHFVSGVVTPPDRVLEIFDRYAKLVKGLWITEYDNDTKDEQLQADYLRDFLTLAFSHPAVQGFNCWSLWDGRNYIPGVAFFRKDWTPRPTVAVWKDLVFKQWWTNASGRTDAKGAFTTRGFLGDYEITVRHAGKTKFQSVRLPKDGAAVKISME